MKSPAKLMTIHPSLVTDFGTRGKCVNCAEYEYLMKIYRYTFNLSAYEFTADIDFKRYCRCCVSRKFPKLTVKYEKTDAKFSCPASISHKVVCDAKELTYDEFYVGSCCKNAALWTYELGKFDRQMTLQFIYDDARKAEDSAEREAENADAKVVEAKKILEKAEKTAADAATSLGEKKKWRKTVQKRALFLANEAMKEDNSDLADETDEDEMENRKKRKIDEEEADKLTCKICFEKYDNEHIEATIIPCGHKSCFQCLSSLTPKNCPTCRARFTKRNLYKLY